MSQLADFLQTSRLFNERNNFLINNKMLNPFFVKSLVTDSDFQIEETPIAESQSGIVFKATRLAKPRKPKLLCAIKRFINNIKTKEDQRNFFGQVAIHSSLHHVAILPFVGQE